jgi:hypothetical protein
VGFLRGFLFFSNHFLNFFGISLGFLVSFVKNNCHDIAGKPLSFIAFSAIINISNPGSYLNSVFTK